MSKAARQSMNGKLKRGSTRGKSIAGRQTNRYTRITTLRVTEVITKQSFNIVKKLGDGAYGVVYLVQKKDTAKLYALKELSKDHILRFSK